MTSIRNHQKIVAHRQLRRISWARNRSYFPSSPLDPIEIYEKVEVQLRASYFNQSEKLALIVFRVLLEPSNSYLLVACLDSTMSEQLLKTIIWSI